MIGEYRGLHLRTDYALVSDEESASSNKKTITHGSEQKSYRVLLPTSGLQGHET